MKFESQESITRPIVCRTFLVKNCLTLALFMAFLCRISQCNNAFKEFINPGNSGEYMPRPPPEIKKAVFGYTPYCEDINLEYRDFRFWESDNFRRYYRDNTYHFGALGLIDLETYASLGTGRGLIEAYSSLSRRANTLISLDQDLIHTYQMVNKVVTIDEPWVWCKYWCSEDLKESSIFIDDCNPP
ncbi:unnamed protein product [Moneuplotes crassus]|uniref:Glucosyltransferase 24 catalytic domain-containing protein n=1 Tax=Euplotes crassus TaxID=5936 RepID=A0AAD1XZU7_EUPCR|nr:unnamed protein product [Moneuplotes crassus]